MPDFLTEFPQYERIVKTSYPWPPKTHLERRLAMCRIAWLLKESGDVESPNAMRALAARLEGRGVPAPGRLLQVVTDMEAMGLVKATRGKGGKSTVKIALAKSAKMPPNPWPLDRATFKAAAPEPAPAPPPPPPPPPPPEVDPIDKLRALAASDAAAAHAPPATNGTTPAPPPVAWREPGPEAVGQPPVSQERWERVAAELYPDQKILAIMQLAGDLLVDELTGDRLAAIHAGALPAPPSVAPEAPTAPSPAPDDDEVRTRLAEALERATRAEGKLKKAEEDLGKAKAALFGKEQELGRARAELSAERRVKRQLESSMRELVDKLKRGWKPDRVDLRHLEGSIPKR